MYITLHLLNAENMDASRSAITSDAQLYDAVRVRCLMYNIQLLKVNSVLPPLIPQNFSVQAISCLHCFVGLLAYNLAYTQSTKHRGWTGNSMSLYVSFLRFIKLFMVSD